MPMVSWCWLWAGSLSSSPHDFSTGLPKGQVIRIEQGKSAMSYDPALGLTLRYFHNILLVIQVSPYQRGGELRRV